MSEAAKHAFIVPGYQYGPEDKWAEQELSLLSFEGHRKNVHQYLVSVALGAYKQREIGQKDMQDIAVQGISYMEARTVAKLGWDAAKVRRQAILEGAEQGHLTTGQVMEEFALMNSRVPLSLDPVKDGNKPGFIFLNSMGLEIDRPRDGYSSNGEVQLSRINDALFPNSETKEACEANDVEFKANQYELAYVGAGHQLQATLLSERVHVSLGKNVPPILEEHDREAHEGGNGRNIYEPFVTILSEEYLAARDAALAHGIEASDYESSSGSY